MTKIEPKPLSWTPVANGPIYCSTACGGGCTRAAHDRALADATALAEALGPGWRPVVKENLGWHWDVHSACNRWKVTRSGNDKSYTAWLGRADAVMCNGTWVESGDTPQAAIRNALRAAKKDIAEQLSWIQPEPAWLR